MYIKLSDKIQMNFVVKRVKRVKSVLCSMVENVKGIKMSDVERHLLNGIHINDSD